MYPSVLARSIAPSASFPLVLEPGFFVPLFLRSIRRSYRNPVVLIELSLLMTRIEADGRSEPDAVLNVCVLVGFSLKASERDFIALLVDLYCAFSSTLSRAFSSFSSDKNSISFFCRVIALDDERRSRRAVRT
ncbi:unnamed protein product [Musa hybrid cultivar]